MYFCHFLKNHANLNYVNYLESNIASPILKIKHTYTWASLFILIRRTKFHSHLVTSNWHQFFWNLPSFINLDISGANNTSNLAIGHMQIWAFLFVSTKSITPTWLVYLNWDTLYIKWSVEGYCIHKNKYKRIYKVFWLQNQTPKPWFFKADLIREINEENIHAKLLQLQ